MNCPGDFHLGSCARSSQPGDGFGLTVLMTEQKATVVLPVADRAALMVRGRFEFLGKPEAAEQRLVAGGPGQAASLGSGQE